MSTGHRKPAQVPSCWRRDHAELCHAIQEPRRNSTKFGAQRRLSAEMRLPPAVEAMGEWLGRCIGRRVESRADRQFAVGALLARRCWAVVGKGP
eukprot:5173878-Pyramimonas_sp.AAC.1